MSLYPIVPNAMVPSIARIDILRLLLDLMAYCLRSNAYGASAGHNLPRHVIAVVLRESREAGSSGSRGYQETGVEIGANLPQRLEFKSEGWEAEPG